MVIAEVEIWGFKVGAVYWDASKSYATFEFYDEFVNRQIDLAPLTMPLEDLNRGQRIFSFPNLNENTYSGLPGLLSDSLPDAYGNQLIRSWLARQGRDANSFSPVEKLAYIGSRGMGALSYSPSAINRQEPKDIELEKLVGLANDVLSKRSSLDIDLDQTKESEAIAQLIQVGTSAGGQRPKAIIAYNEETGSIKSGQVIAPKGYKYYLLKFDGVGSSGLGDPAGYGRIEYSYHKLALACGIRMQTCNLIEENDRAHFITERFDRLENQSRLHMQTLCAIAHYDFTQAGAYSYEDCFAEMRDIGLPYMDFEEMYRRMVLNVIARNQDDHTKNTAFILAEKGEWRLSPAYDITYAYNPAGQWTNSHQMRINAKRDNFTKNDLLDFAKNQGIKKGAQILEEIQDLCHSSFLNISKNAGVPAKHAKQLLKTFRKF